MTLPPPPHAPRTSHLTHHAQLVSPVPPPTSTQKCIAHPSRQPFSHPPTQANPHPKNNNNLPRVAAAAKRSARTPTRDGGRRGWWGLEEGAAEESEGMTTHGRCGMSARVAAGLPPPPPPPVKSDEGGSGLGTGRTRTQRAIRLTAET